jgi:pantoate--beta-alanine ligase
MRANNLLKKFEMDRGQTMTTLFTSRSSFQTWRDSLSEHLTVGFVPTMGALHAGHISLIDQAKASCDIVVVSIYVNVLQFNSETDFTRYPRTKETDFQLCAHANVDAIFAPVKSDLFPEEVVELLTPSSNALGYEGADRPGHFAGVVTVVDRLFSVVKPMVAYFGLKDYQQVAVINDMASQLHPNIVITPCETMRDADGLAMSSRNRFLTPSGRESAASLNIALKKAVSFWNDGKSQSRELIETVSNDVSQDSSIEVQYISVVRNGTMEQVQTVSENDVIVAAIIVDGVRLIDNMSFTNA